MPRKTKTTVIKEDLEDSEIDKSGPLEDDGYIDGLDELRERFTGGKFKLKVYKKDRQGDHYCFQTDESLSEDYLRDEYGGGNYAIRIYVDGHLQETAMLSIAEPLRKDEPQQNTSDTRLFEIMQAETQRMHQLTLAMIQKENNGNSGGMDMKSMVETIVSLKGLTDDKSAMDMMMKGIDLAAKLGSGGGGDWKTTALEIAKEVGTPIIQGVIAAKSQAAAVPRNEVVKENVSLPSENTLKAGFDFLKKQTSFIQVEQAIEWIVNNSNEEQYAQFVRYALENDFDKFLSIDPELADPKYKTWFQSLHEGIKDAFGKSDITEDSSGSIRDDPDTTDNAESSIQELKPTGSDPAS